MKYDELDKLNELRNKGAITEEEYQREKRRILNQPFTTQSTGLWGLESNLYAMIMHLAQFIPGPGWIVSIIMWGVGRDKDTFIDENGKIIINWLVTSVILYAIFGVLAIIVVGIPFLIILGICNVIFVIVGAVKAFSGHLWPYPFSLRIL